MKLIKRLNRWNVFVAGEQHHWWSGPRSPHLLQVPQRSKVSITALPLLLLMLLLLLLLLLLMMMTVLLL